MVGRKDRSEQLQTLIDEVRQAESLGQPIDGDRMIREHPEVADELRAFFATQDLTHSAETPTVTLPVGGSTPEDTPTTGSRDGPPDVVTVEGKVRYFGDYELLKEIARGGMGVVFKARQIKLNRIVALKMILAGQFAGENDVLRFRTEAESAAQLDHPGIVPIFEIGEHEGQHYFSMGYVEGQSLAQRLAEGPLAPRAAAELVVKIAEAMDYAHNRGVIHRDLKPANILIDESGQPKVTDFGLAKKTEADSDLTGTGQIIGTPAFMSPEQARGKTDEVGPLTDVYSLGGILYCLLTGHPPFQAAAPMDVVLQVLSRDPIPVRQLVPTIPRDLDTICNKCLSKDPSKRYGSAAELAADLRRFLDDEPILARPAGRIERASKWASKQPTVAAVLLTLPAWLLGEPKIGVGLLALVAGFHLPWRLRWLRLVVIFAVAAMATATFAALSYLFVQFGSQSTGSAARLAAISLLSAAAPAGVTLFFFLFDCMSGLDQPHRRRARWWLAASAVASVLCIAGFLYYLRGHSEQVSTIVDQLADEIVSLTSFTRSEANRPASGEAMMQLFRSRMVLWIPVFTAIVWLYLVLGIVAARLIRRFVFVTDPTGKVVRGKQHPSRLVKAVDGDVSRWVAITAAVGMTILPYTIRYLLGIYDIALMQAFDIGNPADSFVWILVAAWLAASATLSRRRFMMTSAVATGLALVLSYWTYNSLTSNRREIVTGIGANTGFVTTSDTLLAEMDGHSGPVKCVDVDPAGRRAVSVSGWPEGDGTVRVWDIESGKMLWVRHLAPELMMSACFTSDGSRIVSGGRDGTVCLWETETARELARFKTETKLEGVRVFGDDQYCVIAADSVQVWDLDSQQLAWKLEEAGQWQLDVSISGDGTRVATGGSDNAVHVWELQRGIPVAQITGFPGMVETVALNEDGSRVLVGVNRSDDGAAVLFSVSVDDPNDRVSLSGHTGTVNWVRYSPSWRHFVTASRDRTIRIWDAETLAEIQVFRGHRDWVWSAVFTPDGTRIVSGGGGGGEGGQDPGSDWSLRMWRVQLESP